MIIVVGLVFLGGARFPNPSTPAPALSSLKFTHFQSSQDT